MLLSDRQYKIFNDLCLDSNNYLTSNTIAKKYHISIRTVQTELNHIKRLIDNYDFIEFISVPSKGSKIIVID